MLSEPYRQTAIFGPACRQPFRPLKRDFFDPSCKESSRPLTSRDTSGTPTDKSRQARSKVSPFRSSINGRSCFRARSPAMTASISPGLMWVM